MGALEVFSVSPHLWWSHLYLSSMYNAMANTIGHSLLQWRATPVKFDLFLCGRPRKPKWIPKNKKPLLRKWEDGWRLAGG